ncbi:MAG: glycine cleavage system protein H [Planctomycetes bacterium HGW-Planctomycetes-1]|nr:MAG: glycine cleavage system protein H [Planctomycetes bacterium HGW-Planctomycetes-1]
MVPENLLYTKDHEWADIKGDTATVGIADYAQQSLGEITFVELPAAGKQLNVHDVAAAVESSKAASDIYSPLAGQVAEVNDELSAKPELVNEDCYKTGWIFKLKVSAPDTKHLMNAEQYEEYLKTI